MHVDKKSTRIKDKLDKNKFGEAFIFHEVRASSKDNLKKNNSRKNNGEITTANEIVIAT